MNNNKKKDVREYGNERIENKIEEFNSFMNAYVCSRICRDQPISHAQP